MNAAVMKQSSNIADLFQRVAAHAPAYALTSAAERAERIRKLLKATLDARPAILEAARKELRLCDLDIDMQLLMVKTEANPLGLPKEVFDGIQAASVVDRSKLYRDIASGPLFGFTIW